MFCYLVTRYLADRLSSTLLLEFIGPFEFDTSAGRSVMGPEPIQHPRDRSPVLRQIDWLFRADLHRQHPRFDRLAVPFSLALQHHSVGVVHFRGTSVAQIES